MRDTQRKAFGEAEALAQEQLFKAGHAGDEDIRAEMHYFETSSEAQGFCDVVCDRLSLPRIKVAWCTGSDAMIRGDVIELPPWARQKFTVLHELAHHMTHSHFPPHGAEYVENLLLLLRMFMPMIVSERYLHALLDAGIEISPSPKQALRFLAYARRLGDSRTIKVVTDDGHTYAGALVKYERDGVVQLSGPGVEVPSASLRYATWA